MPATPASAPLPIWPATCWRPCRRWSRWTRSRPAHRCSWQTAARSSKVSARPSRPPARRRARPASAGARSSRSSPRATSSARSCSGCAGEAPDPSLLGPLETLATHAAGLLRRAQLTAELEQSYVDTVAALANALEARDGSTHAHAQAIARLALAVGRRLGLGPDELRELEWAAILHDIGKIAIPDAVLHKCGPLDEGEWDLVRGHTAVGEGILRGIPFLGSTAEAVRSAHERWDGKGYPDRLAGETIPLAARIVFACDVWDVMTSDRPYRAKLAPQEAVARLRAEAGRQLDPHVVDALLATLGAAPADAGISSRSVA